MHSEIVPRLEYGLTVPGLRRTRQGLQTVGGPDKLLLAGDLPPDITTEGRATLNFVVEAGRRHGFTAVHREGMNSFDFSGLDPVATVEETTSAWRSWAQSHRGYAGFACEHVRRSALVLQALTYQPTGAIVAAATTSLPEVPAGRSNWDYRYGWLRDAAIALKALSWRRTSGGCENADSGYHRRPLHLCVHTELVELDWSRGRFRCTTAQVLSKCNAASANACGTSTCG